VNIPALIEIHFRLRKLECDICLCEYPFGGSECGLAQRTQSCWWPTAMNTRTWSLSLLALSAISIFLCSYLYAKKNSRECLPISVACNTFGHFRTVWLTFGAPPALVTPQTGPAAEVPFCPCSSWSPWRYWSCSWHSSDWIWARMQSR